MDKTTDVASCAQLLVFVRYLHLGDVEEEFLFCSELGTATKSADQRCSRGHKARGQGPKKNSRPRPRTAFPRTDPLEAKDRNARGQGPRTQPQAFSKKKGLQKSFSGNLQFIGVARIFNWGGLNHKSHAITSSKICLLAL